MEFNEALRRVLGGHWRLLAVCILLPMLVVGALEAGNARMYVSKARVQASATLPTTDVEANAMLSRVKAVVTSGSVIGPALKQVHVTDRGRTEVARETTVSRLGGSSVFTVKVTDRNPRTAEKLAGSLSEQLVSFLNGSGNLLVTQLTDREHALQAQRVRVASQLPSAKNAADSGRLTAQLGSLDQQILDIQGSLRGAQAAGLGDRTGSLLSSASDAAPAPRLAANDLALAGAIGLVAGLLMATLLEAVRPRVGGPHAFGRELDAPVLGRLPEPTRRTRKAGTGPAIEAETVLALGRAVARAEARVVVLTGPGGEARLAGLAEELEQRLARVDSHPAGTGLRHSRAAGPRTAGTGTLAQNHEATAGSNGGRLAASAAGSDSEVHEGSVVTERLTRVAAANRPRVAPVRVRALHQVNDIADGAGHVLVAVEPELPPYTELRRVRNLAATTGWPVIGVLGDPARPRRQDRSAKFTGSDGD
ncbi:hypothetical protein [Streptomyces gilvus]|uniref:hypothetical protein n=1 Tax=Streptomyces gilvus TaxID=2920937 RepID=UPI001F0D61DE|nr:hypothetical protein [Streptomyces sp. CME 23]MCH5670806.1 hypothetical protein [Streptomyces sp. CME 23]